MKNLINHPQYKVTCKCGKVYETVLDMLNCDCTKDDPPDAGDVADEIYYNAYLKTLKNDENVHNQ